MFRNLILFLVVAVIFSSIQPNQTNGQEESECRLIKDFNTDVWSFPGCTPEEIAAFEQAMNADAEATPNPDKPDVSTTNLSDWTLIDPAKFSDFYEINGEKWILPRGTYYAVSTANGRYEAVVSDPAGEVNGIDYGWCGQTQYDCPPHLALVRFSVPPENIDDVQVVMDISWRVKISNTGSDTVTIRFQFQFNHESRNDQQLLDDYLSAASQGDLALMIATETGTQPIAMLQYEGLENQIRIPFGYSCWDCLANTFGPDPGESPSSIDDTQTGHTGTHTDPFPAGELPGLIMPIPTPSDDPDFIIDFLLEIPPGTTTVIWLGQYDIIE